VLSILRQVFSFLPNSLAKYAPGSHHYNIVKHWEWAHGMHQIKRKDGSGYNRLYVNRGLGSHMQNNIPFRLFCDPEITLFILLSSKD